MNDIAISPSAAVIATVSYHGDNKGFAKLRPQLLVADGQVTVLDEPKRQELFKTVGTIFWWAPPQSAQVGSAWLVVCRASDSQGGSDRYQVETATPALEIVNSPVPSDADLRRLLAGGEVPVGHAPSVRFLVPFPKEPDRYIGPLEAHKPLRPQGSGFVASVSANATGFVPVYVLGNNSVASFNDGAITRRIVLPGLDLRQPIAQFNTQDDETLVASLLPRIRKARPEAAEAMSVTQTAFKTYCELALEASAVTTLDQQKEAERRRASGALIEGLPEDSAAVAQLVGELLETPEIKRRIREQSGTLALGMAESQIADLAPEVGSLKVAKLKLETEISSFSAELTSLKAEEESIRIELQKLVSNEGERIRALLEGSLVRRILSSPGAMAASPASHVPARDMKLVRDIPSLARAITARCIFDGESETSMKLALACLAAQGLVALFGPGQLRLARSISRLVAYDAACEVFVSADLFGINDLLNAAAIPCSEGAPQGLTLGEFIAHYQATRRLVVVVLRGANLAPPECLLAELIEIAKPSPSYRAIGWVDKSGRARTVACEGPIGFLACMTTGKTCFQIAPPLSTELPLVDTGIGWNDSQPATKAEEFVSAIDPDTWRGKSADGRPSLFAADAGLTSTPSERIAVALTALGLERDIAGSFARFALSYGRLSHEAAVRAALVDNLGPLDAPMESVGSARVELVGSLFANAEGSAS